MAGLEGKLDVNLGDIVRLSCESLDVAGYIVLSSPKYITISHENPYSEVKFAWDNGYRTTACKGDRSFLLDKFDSYEILKPSYNPPNYIRKTDAKVGDIVRLDSDGLDVAGYVVRLKPDTIKLSHQNPFSKYRDLWCEGYRKGWGKGDKNFVLNKFENLVLLQKYIKNEVVSDISSDNVDSDSMLNSER